MPLTHKIVPTQNNNQFDDKVFIENDIRSMGRVGKVTGVGYDCGEEIVTYAILDMTGQILSSRDSACLIDFERYFKAGLLQWR